MRPKKFVHGVGINDINAPVKGCPYYDRWVGMLRRCYSKKWKSDQPSYVGTEVCDRWFIFSNFKAWMEKQDWQDKHLDKDLLGNGKLYSEQTCCFIDQHINKFIRTQNSYTFKKKIGVHKTKYGKFEARIKDFRCGRLIHIGTFTDEEAAHQAWISAKSEILKEICHSLTDVRIIEALRRMYEI